LCASWPWTLVSDNEIAVIVIACCSLLGCSCCHASNLLLRLTSRVQWPPLLRTLSAAAAYITGQTYAIDGGKPKGPQSGHHAGLACGALQ